MEDINSMRADTQEFIKKTEEKLKEKEEPIIELYSKEEWKNLKPETPKDLYLIDGLLEKELVLVTGEPGVGKSRFVQYMLEQCCASPERSNDHTFFLGHECYPTEGYYLSLEMRDEQMKRRQKQYCYPVRNNMHYPKLNKYISEHGDVSLSAVARMIPIWCKQSRMKNPKSNILFVIDPLVAINIDVFPDYKGEKSLNNNDYMGKIFRFLQNNVAKKNKCTILIVHHAGKDKSNDILGAQTIKSTCNEVLTLRLLNADNSTYILHPTKVRDTHLTDIYIKGYPDGSFQLMSNEEAVTITNKETLKNMQKLVSHVSGEWVRSGKPGERAPYKTISMTSIEWVLKLNGYNGHSATFSANTFLRSLNSNRTWLNQNGVSIKNLGGRPNKIEITYTPSDVYTEEPEPEPVSAPEQVEKEEKQIQIHDDLPF